MSVPTMNYAIQCTDVVSGKVGSFGYDTKEYLSADKPLQFKAKTPVFPGLCELFAWAGQNGVLLVGENVNWEPKS